ncbi:MAG: septum formation protein Maf [Chloroflexi bacterium]|nr:septum formation protein Maf [Chloroflexota bacterium]
MRTIANLRLASGSPRRAAILREAGFTFAVEPARDMELAPEEDAEPATVAVTLAATKAAEVAGRHREDVVLGADTLVVLGDRILGKPASPDDAAAMLRRLRARTHRVITGVAIEGVLGRAAGTRVTSVRFRRYTDEEVRQYIESGQPMDKAGAYGIQDQPFSPAESIQGCYLNVVGLPLCLTGELLEDIGAFAPDSPRPGCPQCGHARST